MSLFGSIVKTFKKVATNKFVTAAAGGVAVVFPPAAPAAAGLLIAGRIAKGLDSKHKPTKKAAIAVVKRTAVLAKAGNVDAHRALKVLKTVHQARRGNPHARAQVKKVILTTHARNALGKAFVKRFVRVSPRGIAYRVK